ncbi:MAG: CPXCG motif-containing cysteine-rich protein, partial [Gammaproteobacteria bacterium]|nr:CPXCG motif-containing cysteine-rich protein [Gammaproteobacteria bacterium]MDX5375034.1 CPXCG motif-containing cysteine-rich protein [Gammaproteobacteria bacterium]
MTTELLQPVTLDCPYCGEANHTVLDLSAGGQDYIEDCQVCCRPMAIHYALDHAG